MQDRLSGSAGSETKVRADPTPCPAGRSGARRIRSPLTRGRYSLVQLRSRDALSVTEVIPGA